MAKLGLISLAALLVTLGTGCSDTSPQRIGYNAMGGLARAHCQKQTSDPMACSDRPTFDEYQRSMRRQ